LSYTRAATEFIGEGGFAFKLAARVAARVRALRAAMPVQRMPPAPILIPSSADALSALVRLLDRPPSPAGPTDRTGPAVAGPWNPRLAKVLHPETDPRKVTA